MDIKLKRGNHIQKLMKFLPEKLIIKQVQKEWRAKTKGLTKLPKNTKKINSLKTDGTKKIKYQEKTCFKWLCEIEKEPNYTKKQLEFIKWFQEEYYKKSFEAITGKKMSE